LFWWDDDDYVDGRVKIKSLSSNNGKQQRKRRLRINIFGNGDYFVIIAFSSHPVLG